MGIIWRSTMPLLPALAALVIIVNSAEEDLESEYRHDLRPRILDTGTPSYDQPWRAMEADHPIPQQRHTENWDETPDDLPKRRRAGRKRKRRPQTSSDELGPQERFVYPDEPPRPYFDVDFETTHQTTEMPKRRRKKPESRPIRWTDDIVDLERPIRRRGQRRKRPSLEAWPELSEFRETATILQLQGEAITESIDQVNTENIREESPLEDPVQSSENGHELEEKRPLNLVLDLNQRATNVEYNIPIDDGEENIETSPQRVTINEDKSLSEFSLEAIDVPRPTKQTENHHNESSRVLTEFSKAKVKRKIRNFTSSVGQKVSRAVNVIYVPVMYTIVQEKSCEKIGDLVYDEEVHEKTLKRAKLVVSKCQDKLHRLSHQYKIRTLSLLEPVTWIMDEINRNSNLMDPITLKDILKRSNGTSLSEILQQHNLSLTDLLHGKQHAVSIFNSPNSLEVLNRDSSEPRIELSEIRQDEQHKEESVEQTLINSKIKYATEPATEYPEPAEIQTEVNQNNENEPTTTVKPLEEKTLKINTRRRFPLGLRKKLRMRPMLNNTGKGQLSRDLIALNARKYSHHRKNVIKSPEWRDDIPTMIQNNTHAEQNKTIELETTTIAIVPEETTTTIEFTNNNSSSEEINPDDNPISTLDDVNMDMTEATVTSTKEILTEIPKPVTEKSTPPAIHVVRPTVNSSGLRRQAFNNRLKRKRLKHKNATTEPPQDDLIKHLFGIGNLVSSSEFIARTQEPNATEDDSNDPTTLEDFITTESTRKTESGIVQTRTSTTKASTRPTPILSTTEESAKIEIEEILNDTRTSAKLSKILMERNMTLSELVEHRERGSSQVHLADIFHNASREPNPPEPFLSKSLLEPISKETYPLRALLDANLHDPNTRAATVDPSMISNVNIPVVMDFRSNVNENAENMGIMSLFNNFTKPANKSTFMQDSEGRAYKRPIVAVNITNTDNTTETIRESRVLSESQDDVVSWNEIFALMGRTHNNDSSSNNVEGLSLNPFKSIRLDEDTDGDGLIVLEDLQHLKDFESNIASGSDEKIEVYADENNESPQQAPGILDKIPSQTKSVTVATASIAGLAMILFLLTYAAFKWKQQRSVIRKKRSFGDERIPTPVFENRKGHKNNSSTRSISPILQTSNIYTLNTLDSQNGKESPDYMWDTLRKPFQ